jgi:hypothetical protein
LCRGASNVAGQEEIVDPLDRIVVGEGEALPAVALGPAVAQPTLPHRDLHCALGRRVEVSTSDHQPLGAPSLRDETHDRVGLLPAPAIDRGRIEMRIDHGQPPERTLDDRAQCSARLMRSARPFLRRIDRQMKERVLENRPARQNRDAVLAAVVVERTPERRIQPAQLRQNSWLIDVPGTLRSLVDLLQQHEVGIRRPNQLGHPDQIVHARRVLACVNVVDENAHRARGRFWCRMSTHATGEQEQAGRNPC